MGCVFLKYRKKELECLIIIRKMDVFSIIEVLYIVIKICKVLCCINCL